MLMLIVLYGLFQAPLPSVPQSKATGSIDAEVSVPFADIPGVTINYYEVSGRDPAAIRRSINRVRPTDQADGQRVDGLVAWDYRWRWRDNGEGKCESSLDDITFSATVTIPRLNDPKVSPKVREHFNRYLISLIAHEDGHIRNAWVRRREVVDAINSAGCAGAASAAESAARAIAAYDVTFDRETNHGIKTIVPFG
ncbi:DUF922 domain-containing Zn-dependent protease [Sphingomonas sp. R647]|uniref:DUF922 domain-containing protein n=1 Tax=Sphingomonas sp. R647 TaxID=2875233 RepID=UPI001CD709CB|nr:DUF922 domain-containing protein [Sphingomonas sp. R647]MCA1197992.1 DUF922 domain-containing Zn-dependent protease [Sphingomonas sp. R647]